MGWLIDTCVLSESTRAKPDAGVAAFVDSLDWTETYVSVISVGEIWKGIHKLPVSKKRDNLREWFENKLLPSFVNPPLAIDLEVAYRWGELRAILDADGNRKPTLDCLIAVTAQVHHLTVVTRNELDFMHTGAKVFNPWK